MVKNILRKKSFGTRGLLVGALLLGACVIRPIEVPNKPEALETPVYFPQSLEKDIDILFVIDNSFSMKEEQTNLAEQFGIMIQALKSPKLDNQIPNVHIGVVTTDVGTGNFSVPSCEGSGPGDDGFLQNQPGDNSPIGCPTPTDPFISHIDSGNGPVTNVDYSADPASKPADPGEEVEEAFKCIAQLGTGGCGFEHTLESARRALDPELKRNPGFIRDDAFLAVIFITDEDDCSARRDELFDPDQEGLLGPLNSFRCFEFGMTCDQDDLKAAEPKSNCRPDDSREPWLFSTKDYADFFKSLKPAGRTLMFAIAGPVDRSENDPNAPAAKDENISDQVVVGRQTRQGDQRSVPALNPSCTGNGFADPAIRIKSVVEQFGENGGFNIGLKNDRPTAVNICSGDFSPAMENIAQKIVGALGGQCMRRPPLNKDGSLPCAPGIQIAPGKTCSENCLSNVDCVVEEIAGQGTDEQVTKKVNRCPEEFFTDPSITDCGDSCDCWRLIVPTDPDDSSKQLCDGGVDGSPFGLEILRKGNAEPTKGTVAALRCQTSTAKWGTEELGLIPQCLRP